MLLLVSIEIIIMEQSLDETICLVAPDFLSWKIVAEFDEHVRIIISIYCAFTYKY